MSRCRRGSVGTFVAALAGIRADISSDFRYVLVAGMERAEILKWLLELPRHARQATGELTR